MQFLTKKGTTSKRLTVKVLNSTNGTPLTGLAFNSASLAASYWREDTGNAGGTSITLATSIRGTWTSGAFKEIDSTNLPGFYEIGIPDAALAIGSEWVMILYAGAANMLPVNVFIQLQVGPYPNRAIGGFSFPMFTAAGALKTGETITATRSIDGAAFASCANSAAEIGTTGVYAINLAASDLNGSSITLNFTSANTVPSVRTILMEG